MKIYEDELWPYYELSDSGDYEIQLSPEETKHIVNVLKDFKEIQNILKAKYKEEEEKAHDARKSKDSTK